MVLNTDTLQTHVQKFNADDRWFFGVGSDAAVSSINNGVYGGQHVNNADAFDYLSSNIPLFDAPDAGFVETYNYRWWTFRKHIKNLGTEQSPNYTITEFIDPVPWADSTNAINAPAGHQLYEGRWLRDTQVITDYQRHWMDDNRANPRRYSTWLADGMLAVHKVNPDAALVTELVASTTNRLNLDTHFSGWINPAGVPGGATQVAHFDPDGLFFQADDRDAMENSYGGHGRRPSINAYMYGDARAIASMYRIAAKHEPANAAAYNTNAQQYDQIADTLRAEVQSHLWDSNDQFFKTNYATNAEPANSADTNVSRHTWWEESRRGTEQWVQYDFSQADTINRAEVYWYQDTAEGGTRTPASWKLQVHDGSAWVDVALEAGQSYGTGLDTFNAVSFSGVQADKVRLVAQLQDGFSAGTLEWRVFSDSDTNVALGATASASYTDVFQGTITALNNSGNENQPRREQIGFTPWYFNMPEDGGAVDYDEAWSHLASFATAHGLTSGAYDENGYNTGAVGSCCRWDGPIWPYATSITLKAMSNLINNYEQGYITEDEFFEQLAIYTDSHYQQFTQDGETRTLNWIDESMVSGGNSAGEWTQIGINRDGSTGNDNPRGLAYNHSSYVDLIITDLIGLKPREDDIVEIDPLLPDGEWDYFALDNVSYHGSNLTIIWDKDGSRYGLLAGLQVYEDGVLIAHSTELQRTTGELGVPIPEPSSFALLGIAGLLVIRR
ncbi:MAG: discoidin domain-containing protein [Planctomycetota bacterium]